MSSVGKAWHRLSHRGQSADEGDSRAALRQAIARTRVQQARLTASAGGMFVKRAEIDGALEQQRLVLTGAAEQIRQAMAVAQRAAGDARADEGVDASPYEMTAHGLQTQLDVVQTALGQLGTMREDATQNLTRAQAMIRANAAALDGALRAEVQLLGRLERLERERIILEARVRGRQAPPSGAQPG